MATTLKDIADRSGVSIKTVSRVLNKEPNVSLDTRERVEQAASELGYRPNLAARGLASSKSFLIALLYDDVSTSYILNLMNGATEACRAEGYHLVVEPVSNAKLDSPTAVARLMRRLNVDGLILTPPLTDNAAILESLDLLGMSAVRLAPMDVAGAQPSFTVDNRGAAREVVAHLAGLGHTRIGFIKGLAGHSATQERLEGYRSALGMAGIAFDPALVADGDFTWRSGRSAMAALAPAKPTAVFASNDDMAAGVLSWAGEAGLRVPDDLAVAGFDDTSLSRALYPPLTTVGQDVVDMGRRAVKMLIHPQSRVPETRFDLSLVVRGSTDPSVSETS